MPCTSEVEKDPSTVFQPNTARSCWDVNLIALLLFFASWAGIAVIFAFAVQQGGTPDRITHGVNWRGEVCGRSFGVENAPYAAWIAMPSDFSSSSSSSSSSGSMSADCTDCYQIMACLGSCNETETSVLLVDHYTSRAFLYHCMPTQALTEDFPYGSDMQDASTMASQAFADLYTTWPVIMVSVLVALVGSFVYTWFTRLCAGWVIAVSIICTIVGGVCISVALLTTAQSYEYPSSESGMNLVTGRYYTLRVLGILAVVLTALFMLFVCMAMRHLRIAAVLMREASKVFIRVPQMVVFALMPSLATLAYFVLFIYMTILLATVWTTKEQAFPPYIVDRSPARYALETRLHFSFNDSLKKCFAYLFLHMLWVTQFIVYFSYMVISTVVSRWYFTRSATGRTKDKQIAKHIVRAAVFTTSRFHLGSIAMGSFLLSIIKFMRFAIIYAESRLRQRGDCGCGCNLPSCLQTKALCCAHCALSGMQFVISRMNEYAFIWIATWGDGLCMSAERASQLISRNLASCAVMGLVGVYFSIIGKLLVACVTTGASALVMQRLYVTDAGGDGGGVHSIALSVGLVFLISLVVASIALTVLSTSVDTMFMCYLMDEEMSRGDPRGMFASTALKNVVFKTMKKKFSHDQASSRASAEVVTHDGNRAGGHNGNSARSSGGRAARMKARAPTGSRKKPQQQEMDVKRSAGVASVLPVPPIGPKKTAPSVVAGSGHTIQSLEKKLAHEQV